MFYLEEMKHLLSQRKALVSREKKSGKREEIQHEKGRNSTRNRTKGVGKSESYLVRFPGMGIIGFPGRFIQLSHTFKKPSHHIH